MKKIILLFLLAFSFPVFSYSSVYDTTFTAYLTDGAKLNNISLKIVETNYEEVRKGKKHTVTNHHFVLDIDGKSVIDTLPYYDFVGIELIDLNKNDKSKELLISSGGSPDYTYWVIKFFNEPKVIYKAESYFDFNSDGKGNATATFWPGWCRLTDKFVLSNDGTKLEKVLVDYYPVKKYEDETPSDYTANVVKPFKLLSERNENSKVVVEIKVGQKITIIGYDTKYIVNGNAEEEYENQWCWILMKTSDNKQGWILMKAFDQNFWNSLLEGVYFAG